MEAVQGKRLIYLYRRTADRASEAGTLISFVTENGRSVTNDADSTATKDGSIRTPGTPEMEITSTSILAQEDTLISKFEQATLDGDMIECWEANLDEPGTGQNKFKGRYFQGYFTSFEKSSPADGYVEISLTYSVNGKGATGDVTVTDAQQEEAMYAFADSVVATTGG